MTVFDTYGHLTKQALDAWAEGSLCTQQRLQVAEHLAVCDVCLLRMTALDEDTLPLITPEKDLVKPAVQKVREHRVLDVLKRCGVVAAAACFMLLTWRFDLIGSSVPPETEQPPQPVRPSTLQLFAGELSDGLFAWGTGLSDTLQDTFTLDEKYETAQRSDDHE